MAKQPETQDRFRLHFDTSREMMGVAIAELARVGINNVQYELITDVLAFQTKNAPRVFDISSLELARTFIVQHHSFKAKELVAVFEQEERTGPVAYAALKKLVELGELRKLEAGHYRSTNIKVLAAPDAEAEPAKPDENTETNAAGRGGHKRYEVSNIVLVWNGIKQRKKVSRPEMIKILEANERPKTSVNGLTAKLVESGRLKSLGEGWYDVIKQQPAKDD